MHYRSSKTTAVLSRKNDEMVWRKSIGNVRDLRDPGIVTFLWILWKCKNSYFLKQLRTAVSVYWQADSNVEKSLLVANLLLIHFVLLCYNYNDKRNVFRLKTQNKSRFNSLLVIIDYTLFIASRLKTILLFVQTISMTSIYLVSLFCY